MRDEQVELTGLPGGFSIEERSVAVKGSGHCTILDVSFSDNLVGGGASPGSVSKVVCYVHVKCHGDVVDRW